MTTPPKAKSAGANASRASNRTQLCPTTPGSRRLVMVLIVAVALAAGGSYSLATWLKLKTSAGQLVTIGKSNGKPPAFLAGSSLATYGISWDEIAAQLDTEIKVFGIAGSSPFEWEQFQAKAPDVKTSFIVVSAYDLDEALICDFRAYLVPITHTIKTLFEIHSGWDYSKRALSQYPMTWLRAIFPTLGRSRGVMGNLRVKILKLIKPSARISEAEAGPTLTFGKRAVADDYEQERISTWSKSKILGKIVAMRASFHGGQSFDGPKKMALKRMLHYAEEKGPTLVVVLPISNTYAREFMTTQTVRAFEAALTEVQASAPRIEWLRLDQKPDFQEDENFCDLVHMNLSGKKKATEAVAASLENRIHSR